MIIGYTDDGKGIAFSEEVDSQDRVLDAEDTLFLNCEEFKVCCMPRFAWIHLIMKLIKHSRNILGLFSVIRMR